MDGFSREVLGRLPLAEAVLRLWAYLAEESFLQQVFQRHRGRCYEQTLSFSLFCHLIAEALLEHRGSAHQAFQRAERQQRLEVSQQAAYGKLRRLPIALSNGFLLEGGLRLLELLPEPESPLPESLAGWSVTAVDGKKLKNAAKRLKPARGSRGRLLGGKALVGLSLPTGLVVGMNADPDGETNDGPLVPGLLNQLRPALPGPRLWVADRQFCDLTQPARFAEAGDHFLVRYHPKVHFQRDAEAPVREGSDPQGRPWREEWGWIGRPQSRRRRYVRRITLFRGEGEEDVILITNLLDADAVPAVDLLAVYRRRWGIERVFQQVSEVFHLKQLIASTPEGTIFQCAFCLLLYNMIELVRHFVAQPAGVPLERVSLGNLFYDVHRQLIAWNELLGPSRTEAALERLASPGPLRARLEALLSEVWTPRWEKAAQRKRKPPPERASLTGGHTSVYRLIQQARREPPGDCKDV